MASSADPSGSTRGQESPRAARARMEEAMEKLDLTEEEATPLMVDDLGEGGQPKWAIVGKVLHRKVFHIQTIASALRPTWGNPKGLSFRPAGENMFVAEFENHRDHDRTCDGSPWHVSRHVVILAEFDDFMKLSELKFDKLKLWARVLNLSFNLQSETWGRAIAKQIDKDVTSVQFDPVGGFLRARVTIDVNKPLRRWILIDSAKRKSRDWYDIQYEQVPNFCFSCGRLGHADLVCPTPGTRNDKGDLPLKTSLRATEDRRASGSSDGSSREQQNYASNKKDDSSSTNKASRRGMVAQSLRAGACKYSGYPGAALERVAILGAKEFGSLAKKVKKLQAKLGKLRYRTIGRGPCDEEKAIVLKLREALRQRGDLD
ncbi:hypothetical protein D1007_40151 [Hordeum vulgare]|nr:hypothetical protein D1007_40151 [Hordeum vulgare]